MSTRPIDHGRTNPLTVAPALADVIDVQQFAWLRGTIPPERGNCYQAALRVAASMVTARPFVAHGAPLGQAPADSTDPRAAIAGQRFGHAWVEVVLSGIPSVIDFASDYALVTTRRAYYQQGRVDGRDVVRYTPEEAFAMMEATGHCGPWHDGAEPWVGVDGGFVDVDPLPAEVAAL